MVTAEQKTANQIKEAVEWVDLCKRMDAVGDAEVIIGNLLVLIGYCDENPTNPKP